MRTLLCLWVLMLVGASFAVLSPAVSTFVIGANSEQSFSVELKDAYGVTISCTLDYDTSTTSESTKKHPPVAALIDEITQKYGCLSMNVGIFKYKVCLGKNIEQTTDNGDNYSLGKFEGLHDEAKPSQTYSEGDYCDPAHAKRRTSVEFSCTEGRPQIMSIDEPSVCVYRIIIGVPEVCGHPKFNYVSKLESWVLELAETSEGEFVCQTYNNGFDVIGTNSFAKFSLAFKNADLTLTKHVVRRKNRKVVEDDILRVGTSPASVALVSRSQIDYAKIVAE